MADQDNTPSNVPNEFSGTWHLKYWYPSEDDYERKDISEYDGAIEKHDDHYVYQSSPNEDESYIFVRLFIDDDVVSGTWQENTSPHKEFKGAIYSGSFQLLLNADRTEMVGLHVGDGFREGHKHIYDGRFEIIKVKD